MAAKRYTLVESTDPEAVWVIHKPGCANIAINLQGAGTSKRLVKVDLEDTDEEVLADIDAYMEMTMDDVHLCVCTGYATEDPTPPSPQPPAQVHAAAEASRKAAAERLKREVETIVDNLVATRGVDDIGEGDQWADERLPTCTDDYVYDLAVEVRKQRSKGESWWRVGYELGLPGAGASNKQGRKGAAYARRLWRAAWGATYAGERSQRESKATREVRALENLGRPYFSDADEDNRVVETLRGQMIHWVTRLSGKHGIITSAQETYVHDDPKFIRVKQGPQGRYVEFYEQLDPSMLLADPRKSITKSGPLRAVYVDRITRVGV